MGMSGLNSQKDQDGEGTQPSPIQEAPRVSLGNALGKLFNGNSRGLSEIKTSQEPVETAPESPSVHSATSNASGSSRSQLRGPREPHFKPVSEKPLPTETSLGRDRVDSGATQLSASQSSHGSSIGIPDADVVFPKRTKAITTSQQQQEKRMSSAGPLPSTPSSPFNATIGYGSSPRGQRPMSAAYYGTSPASNNRPLSEAVYSSSPRNSIFMPSRSFTQNSYGNQSILSSMAETDLDAMPEVSLPGFTPFPERMDTFVPPSTVAADTAHPPDNNSATSLLRKFSRKFLPSRHISQREHRNYRRSHLPRQDLLNLGGISAIETETTLQRAKETKKKQNPDIPQSKWWYYFAHIMTFYAPNFILRQKYCCNRTTEPMQIAWREKMGLMSIIVSLWVLLGFLTFGFQNITCDSVTAQRFPLTSLPTNNVAIRGVIYNVKDFTHPTGDPNNFFQQLQGKDSTWLFPLYPQLLDNGVSACDSLLAGTSASVKIACTVDNVPSIVGFCHTLDQFVQVLTKLPRIGQVSYKWDDLRSTSRMVVVNGFVINVDRYFSTGGNTGAGFLGPDVDKIILRHLGSDATQAFMKTGRLRQSMECLAERFRVGVIESVSVGCFASQAFMWTSLATLLSVIILKFILSLWFNWTLGNSLGKKPKSTFASDSVSVPMSEATGAFAAEQRSKSLLPKKSRFSLQYNTQSKLARDLTRNYQYSVMKKRGGPVPKELEGILRSILLVTCYSEGEASIRATLDSCARTDFPDSHKILFIIADGIIHGAGNDRSTPDLLRDMILMDPRFGEPEAFSYIAIADGQKRHNMAKVYAGQYHVEGHVVPTILVVKCGTPEEAEMPKPGNRGKRDSQILLMQFLTKVLFDDRMTSLEYDLFRKMTAVCSTEDDRITPDFFELVLMVDADTKVMKDSLTVMSYAMYNDPRLIGLCGETRIANKSDSWVTAIQVFEYYISHFLTKSFESLFGSNTCLPGCFCMYRIKAPKGGVDANGEQYFTPILANPDIVEHYSENVVDTLHKKNLLLLGEDRYLTTLMLKTFPKRKLMFIPNAVCKTVVPDRFRVLLSQRRRWINSTFHNLLELVWIRDLCGIFCFSMQFVIFMELVGTAVLPAAICFTIYLLVISFITVPPPIIPLALLAAILGLPAFLILLSSRRWIYIGWMIIYLISLPIWNFVLPVYAYWHFDDFSWGQTRKIEGGDTGHDEDEGEFDHSKITMKRWYEWEKEERRKTYMVGSTLSSLSETDEYADTDDDDVVLTAEERDRKRQEALTQLTRS